MPSAGDGDRRPIPDGERFERRLAESGEAIVAGDAQVHRHDALANQAVRQVAGHIGFTLTRAGSYGTSPRPPG